MSSKSFALGLLAGIIITLIIVLILYVTQLFIFANCNVATPTCRRGDYILNPSTALDEGYQLDQILFQNSEGEILYKRPPAVSGCIPNADNQTVTIKNPQYCIFTTTDANQYEAKNTFFESPVYNFTTSNGTPVEVLSSGNCNPEISQPSIVTSGIPELKWTDY